MPVDAGAGGQRASGETALVPIMGRAETHLLQDLGEEPEDLRFVQLVAVELEPLDELLDGALGLEGEQGETEGDVAPLAGVFGEAEPLAELLDDVLCLLLLEECGAMTVRPRAGGMLARARTFSMKVKMYFIVLWNVSSSIACAPTDR